MFGISTFAGRPRSSRDRPATSMWRSASHPVPRPAQLVHARGLALLPVARRAREAVWRGPPRTRTRARRCRRAITASWSRRPRRGVPSRPSAGRRSPRAAPSPGSPWRRGLRAVRRGTPAPSSSGDADADHERGQDVRADHAAVSAGPRPRSRRAASARTHRAAALPPTPRSVVRTSLIGPPTVTQRGTPAMEPSSDRAASIPSSDGLLRSKPSHSTGSPPASSGMRRAQRGRPAPPTTREGGDREPGVPHRSLRVVRSMSAGGT